MRNPQMKITTQKGELTATRDLCFAQTHDLQVNYFDRITIRKNTDPFTRTIPGFKLCVSHTFRNVQCGKCDNLHEN